MRWWAAFAASALASCASEPTADPSSSPVRPDPPPVRSPGALLMQGEMGLSNRIIVKKAALQGGRYSIVLENTLSEPLECRVEVRYIEGSGRLLIPSDPRARVARFKPRGQVGLEGRCEFPEAARVGVRLSE